MTLARHAWRCEICQRDIEVRQKGDTPSARRIADHYRSERHRQFYVRPRIETDGWIDLDIAKAQALARNGHPVLIFKETWMQIVWPSSNNASARWVEKKSHQERVPTVYFVRKWVAAHLDWLLQSLNESVRDRYVTVEDPDVQTLMRVWADESEDPVRAADLEIVGLRAVADGVYQYGIRYIEATKSSGVPVFDPVLDRSL